MADNTRNLKESWNRRSTDAKLKAMDAIETLKRENRPVNFNSVHLHSGVSKHFLYQDAEVREKIDSIRKDEGTRKRVWHNKYDKTSKSKDVIIETKDKYIAKLEAENKKLRNELNRLRAMIYEEK